VIRPATTDDVDELGELAARTWMDTFGAGLAAEDAASEIEERRSARYFADALERTTLLVAEQEGGLVGYVQLGDVTFPEIAAQPEDGAIHRVYVATPLQGRGIGRALTEAALAHRRLVDAPRVYLSVWEKNERAIGLYRSFGFLPIGTTRFTVGSEVLEDLVMVLDRRTGRLTHPPTAKSQPPTGPPFRRSARG